MDTDSAEFTTPDVARMLGVSLPAAHHALDEVGVPRTGRGRVRTVDAGTARALLAARGSRGGSAVGSVIL